MFNPVESVGNDADQAPDAEALAQAITVPLAFKISTRDSASAVPVSCNCVLPTLALLLGDVITGVDGAKTSLDPPVFTKL